MRRHDEGTPLTNGEVYAILRRNRDLRYAKGLPPFGMQSRGAPVSGAMQAFNPSWRNQRSDTKAAQKEAAIRASADFINQNTVALNEVRGLFYLKESAVEDYGVSSVYSASFTPCKSSHKVTPSDGCSAFLAVNHFGPVGTKQHVTRVVQELDALERRGRQAQLREAKLLKELVSTTHPSLALTESELRSLLNLRPQSEVTVSAVVTNMEERLKPSLSFSKGNSESVDAAAAAAAASFAQSVIKIFTSSALSAATEHAEDE